MRVLAFDPDTTTSGWAVVSHDTHDPLAKRSTIHRAGVIKSQTSEKGDVAVMEQIRQAMVQIDFSSLCVPGYLDAVLIEGQYFIQGKTQAEDMYNVAWVTGGLAALLLPYVHRVHTVSPRLWTKGTSKDARMSKCENHWFTNDISNLHRQIGCLQSEVNHALDAAGMGRWWLMNYNTPMWRNRNNKPARSKSTRRTTRRRRR